MNQFTQDSKSPLVLTEVISLREELQQAMQPLSLEELELLLIWLKALVKERKREHALQQIPLKQGREVLETRNVGKTTYRLEKVKCGKKKCKCNQGKLHGPYWYAYQWNGKKLSSHYIGKTLKAKADTLTEECGGDS